MKNVLIAVCMILAVRAASPAQSPSFAKDIRPFFAKYCLECHNAKALKGGLSLETFKSVLEGSDKGPVFSAGKADESPLVAAIEGKSKTPMPPKTAKLHPKAEEIALVRAWVAAGAKDDGNLINVVIPDIKPRQTTPAPVMALAYNSTGQFLAVGKHKLVEVVDIKNGIVTTYPQAAAVTALAFASSRLAVAFGSPGARGSIIVHDMSTFPPATQSLADLHRDAILDVSYSPDGKLLASASYDTQIKLTPIGLGIYGEAPIRILKEHSDAVYAVAFSPDGKLLASCSADRAVKVWDVASGKLLYTLGDATDWLYTLAWSPDGKRLAAGGVDKSIRVYEASASGAKIVHSVFAHEAAVQKIVYARDGKTLYSLGQDRVIKAWDADRLVEAKTYDRLPDSGLCLAVRPGEIAVGRYDGVMQILNAASGKVVHELGAGSSRTLKRVVDPFPIVTGQEGHNSPGTGQPIKLPASVIGKLGKAGDFAFYRFDATKGQQLGVQAVTKEAGSKLSPYLHLSDEHGKILAESSEGFLGYTFSEAGDYALGIRDQDFRGGADMHYRLHLGEIPVVTSLFPLGLQRSTAGDVHVHGVFLGADKVHVKIPDSAAPGSKIAVAVPSKYGTPLGKLEISAGEFAEVVLPERRSASSEAQVMPVPGTANGRLAAPAQADTWKFSAKKGERLVVETNARRLGSALDSVLEILDTKGNPVPRAVLRCQAKTFTTFRDHDSAGANIRIEAWGELGVNDLLYVNGDLMKIRELPTHPDADCIFFSARGQRLGYLGTTPTHHAMNEPMYKVTLHPPGTTFPPNGYPVFTLFYRNDDGGPGYGRDSFILFDPPADGDYLARISDGRGQGGDGFGYRLTIRPPRPSFNVAFSPTNPTISRGGAVHIRITADRLDGYDGPIAVHFDKLPPGFAAPPTTIEGGQTTSDVSLYASDDAKTPASAAPLHLLAEATIDGKKISTEASGETPKTMDPGDIVTVAEQSEITVRPGGQVKLTVQIERRNKFAGRVPLEVRGLPHGVRVIDLGLNGILVNETETRRTIVIYAEPWVEALSRPFVVLAKREGKNTDHAAKAVVLNIQR